MLLAAWHVLLWRRPHRVACGRFSTCASPRTRRWLPGRLPGPSRDVTSPFRRRAGGPRGGAPAHSSHEVVSAGPMWHMLSLLLSHPPRTLLAVLRGHNRPAGSVVAREPKSRDLPPLQRVLQVYRRVAVVVVSGSHLARCHGQYWLGDAAVKAAQGALSRKGVRRASETLPCKWAWRRTWMPLPTPETLVCPERRRMSPARS